ncbi:MAG TPA: AAA-like domain-containing protein [Blastocatellia bacterium]|jgi:hypothetical protein|nr:AAA-like domain-containing protein [Blastocatellia bacterium]
MSKTGMYTVGGTVQVGSGLYIPRRADDDLLSLCRAGSFSYILTPRQMGKSSLMVRAAERLAEEDIQSVIIDLTQLGVQVTAEEWYLGLLVVIEDQLMLDTDVVKWWQERAHLGITQRLALFFQEVLLTTITRPTVIFIDEIDTTLGLDFTDDFFAAIRYFYNARASTPVFQRLSFVLIGVAKPGDLIRDPQRTPFNIGHRVDLSDWTLEEALPLADGLGMPTDAARQLLRWVLKWTGGHPYLTQRLCRALVDEGHGSWSEADVERVVASTFFGEKSEQDNNLQFVRDMLTKRTPGLEDTLTTYREIRRNRQPVRDEEQSLVKSHLKLSGIVCREDGFLRVRNPIYKTVFDESWIKEHLPSTWTKQQMVRVRRAAIALIVILLFVVPMGLYAASRAVEAEKQRQIAVAARQEAEERRQEAEDQRQEAERQRQIAEGQRQEAERQRSIAESSAWRERAAKQLAQKQSREAERLAKVAEAEKQEVKRQEERTTLALKRAESQLAELDRQKKNTEKARQEMDRLRKASEKDVQQ